MKVYEDPNTGDVYRALNAAGIVRQMSTSKLKDAPSRAAYREGVATRLREAMGLQVDPSSDTVFLASLVEAGVLVERD